MVAIVCSQSPLYLINPSLPSGMVAIASSHGDVTSTILQTMMDKSESELKDTHCKFLALGLALTYLGKQEEAALTIEALKVVGDPLGKMAATLVEVKIGGKCVLYSRTPIYRTKPLSPSIPVNQGPTISWKKSPTPEVVLLTISTAV